MRGWRRDDEIIDNSEGYRKINNLCREGMRGDRKNPNPGQNVYLCTEATGAGGWSEIFEPAGVEAAVYDPGMTLNA